MQPVTSYNILYLSIRLSVRETRILFQKGLGL